MQVALYCTIKKIFYRTEKLCFILEIFRFLYFQFSSFKDANFDVIINIKSFENIWQSIFLTISIKPIRLRDWNLVNMNKKTWQLFSYSFFWHFCGLETSSRSFPDFTKMEISQEQKIVRSSYSHIFWYESIRLHPAQNFKKQGTNFEVIDYFWFYNKGLKLVFSSI